jgi:hypothetical protein
VAQLVFPLQLEVHAVALAQAKWLGQAIGACAAQVPLALQACAVSMLALQASVPQAVPEGYTQAPVASQAVAAQPVSEGQLAALQQKPPRQRLEAHIVPTVHWLPPPPPVEVPLVLVVPLVPVVPLVLVVPPVLVVPLVVVPLALVVPAVVVPLELVPTGLDDEHPAARAPTSPKPAAISNARIE